MRVGRVMLVALVVAGAFLVGNGLAALPYWDSDPCITSMPSGFGEGGSTTVDYGVWPLGVECVYSGAGGGSVTVRDGAGWGAVAGWTALAMLLFGLALARRRSCAARGAMEAAVLLGMLGWFSELAGIVPAAVWSLLLGVPLITWLDARLRPPEQRDVVASMVTATAIVVTALVAWTAGWAIEREGLATLGGLAVAALVAAALRGRNREVPQLG